MTIVDTSIWIDYLRGASSPHADWLDRELTRQRLAITDLILCEVLQGIPTERRARAVQRELERLEIVSTGGAALAVRAAAHYRLLRGRGVTIRRTIDCLIATSCLQHGHSLLHNDRDFDPFEDLLGLSVIHP